VAHQGLRPGLKEEAELALVLHERDQDGILPHGPLNAQFPALKILF
jgi:hypothetical protein